MPKGLYLHFDEVGNPRKSGIRNKIDGQRLAFSEAGYPTDVIYFMSKKALFFNDRQILRLPSRQLFFRYFIFRRIGQVCRENSYRFIYIRYFKSDRYFLGFLKKVKSPGTKIFIEFPTFPYDSEMAPKNAVERFMDRQDRRYRTRLHKFVDHAASVVRQPGDILNIPTFGVDNGVDLQKIPVTPSRPLPGEIRIIGVANLSRWHAWDRVIRGLHRYYRDTPAPVRITFRIIGEGSASEELRMLRDELGMQEHVRFTGPRMGADLDREFESADLAMGTLGLHRIGLSSGSVLKLREYTARGLPSVIGYQDAMVTGQEPFIHQVPPDDSPLDMEQLVTFFRGVSLSPMEIRQFASEHFSWTGVLKPVLERI